MERFSSTEVDEAKKFGEFFIDLLENRQDNCAFYLSESVLLDWFGHTIKGIGNIETFLKNNSACHKQNFNPAKPVTSIGYRDTHVVKYPSKQLTEQDLTNVPSTHTNNEVTPPPPCSLGVEQGQGDGLQNNIVESPRKKCKFDDKHHAEGIDAVRPKMKYIQTEGHIEFRKKSTKKFQAETKWNRPCKLQIAYCGDSFENCTICMIIYQGNMKCKRNLLKDFESCEPTD